MDAERQGCVLVFRLGSIGDTVVALPCFHGIARAYPNHRRVLLTNALTSRRASSAESVLDGTGLVNEVIYYPVGDFSPRQVLSLILKIRRMRPVILIYLAERPRVGPVVRDFAFFTAAGALRIVGLPWSRTLREGRVDAQTLEVEQEALRLARLLEGIVPVSLSPANWELRLSAAELAAADRLLRSMESTDPPLGIAPGAKIAAKDWGSDNWASLLRSQAAKCAGMGLVMVGAADERALCEDLAPLWKGPVLNLCGTLSPRETAAALRHCKLLVCHDSGPMHLAATQQTRCIALFGNYNRPRKWYPFGSGHRVVYEPKGVREITVPRVAAEIDRALVGEDPTAHSQPHPAG
jgi:ADP-heptose:LPS heptosyltransferase